MVISGHQHTYTRMLPIGIDNTTETSTTLGLYENFEVVLLFVLFWSFAYFLIESLHIQ